MATADLQAAASVAHQGQGESFSREDTGINTDIDARLEREPQTEAVGQLALKGVAF